MSSEFRHRLERFYTKYQPEKMGNIDKILTVYQGKEEQLMVELVQKYGPEPVAVAAAAASNSEQVYRDRLTRFYQRYQPEKMGNIDKILTHYKGNEEKMMSDLVAKYGPEPSLAPATTASVPLSDSSTVFRERLTRFYTKYQPEKMGNIDKILTVYQGKEEQLMIELVQKYGPEPVAVAAAAATAPVTVPSSSDYRVRLTRFLAKYSPDKLHQVEAMLAKYSGGKEEAMMAALVSKFGPEPAATTSDDVVPAAGAATATFKKRVERLLKRYAPDKASQADAMLQKYQGREAQLLEALVTKFGPEPAEDFDNEPSAAASRSVDVSGSPAVSAPPASSYPKRLERFLQRYAPDKLSTADAMLQKYRGSEEVMFSALVAKFGPEPEDASSNSNGTAAPLSSTPAVGSSVKPPLPPSELLQNWIGKKGVESLKDQSFLSLSAIDDEADRLRRWEQMVLFVLCVEASEALSNAKNNTAASSSSSSSSVQQQGDDPEALAISYYGIIVSFLDDSKSPSSKGVPPAVLPLNITAPQIHLAVNGAIYFCSLKKEVDDTVSRISVLEEEEVAALRDWSFADAARAKQLSVQRMHHRALVIERALEMVGTIEGEYRVELWRAQEIEAHGRFIWFQERRRELTMMTKPPALEHLESKFQRWKELVREQQSSLDEDALWVRHQRRNNYSNGSSGNNQAPLQQQQQHAHQSYSPSSGTRQQLRDNRTVVNRSNTTKEMFDAGASVTTPRSVGGGGATPRSSVSRPLMSNSAAHRRQDSATPTRTPRLTSSYSSGASQSHTPRRTGGERTSPRSLGRYRDPADDNMKYDDGDYDDQQQQQQQQQQQYNELRSGMALQRRAEWNGGSPHRSFVMHPKDAAVTPSPRPLPPKIRIPKTIPAPFSLSYSSR